ncbi:hypothetical protein C3L33_17555, partial [Rhododendron williamsianum]
MTCTAPCRFEFCWLCLGAYSGHGQCNRYKATDEAERKREMAKMSIQRYTHYYERWATNESSRQKALAGLHEMQTVNLKKLSDKQSQPETQLKFMTEAWLQIVECRRVLKWTYAYGYYLPEPELAKRQFFEYLQGEAEAGLERLHLCAEKDSLTSLQVPNKEEKSVVCAGGYGAQESSKVERRCNTQSCDGKNNNGGMVTRSSSTRRRVDESDELPQAKKPKSSTGSKGRGRSVKEAVKNGLENGLPGITVLVNPEKDLKRPFKPMKELDMDDVIADIIGKIK